jgi:hypothetical protein
LHSATAAALKRLVTMPTPDPVDLWALAIMWHVAGAIAVDFGVNGLVPDSACGVRTADEIRMRGVYASCMHVGFGEGGGDDWKASDITYR